MASSSAADFETGELQVVIPPDAKPTRMERTYRVRWMVTFKGQVASFPDLHESYEIKVLPADSPAP